jgi:hypothetical protein
VAVTPVVAHHSAVDGHHSAVDGRISAAGVAPSAADPILVGEDPHSGASAVEGQISVVVARILAADAQSRPPQTEPADSSR